MWEPRTPAPAGSAGGAGKELKLFASKSYLNIVAFPPTIISTLFSLYLVKLLFCWVAFCVFFFHLNANKKEGVFRRVCAGERLRLGKSTGKEPQDEVKGDPPAKETPMNLASTGSPIWV